jgi:hypothetical protein
MNPTAAQGQANYTQQAAGNTARFTNTAATNAPVNGTPQQMSNYAASLAAGHPTVATTPPTQTTSSNLPTPLPGANTMSSQPVVTADAANADLAQKLATWQSLQASVQGQKSAIDRQNQQAAADKAQTDYQNAELQIKQQDSNTNASTAASKAAAVAGLTASTTTPDTTNASTSPTGPNNPTSAPNNPVQSPDSALNDYTIAEGKISDQQTTAYNQFSDQLNSVMNGTFPMSATQSSLISSLQKQLADNTVLQQNANNSQTGAAREAAFRAGGEYSPQEAANSVANVVNQGVMRIQELDNSAASAMGKLEQDFQTQDYTMINDSYNALQKQLDSKSTAVTDLYDKTTAALKAAQDQKQLDEQKQYDQIQKPIQDIVGQLSKNGAPQSVIDAAKNSKDVTGAMTAAAGYLNDPTSTAGMYSAYTRNSQASGKTPMSAGDFMAAQKYADALATAKASSAYKYQDAYAAAAGKNAADAAFSSSNEGQDKLEKDYSATLLKELSNRSGGLGLQDQKVNQAIHLKALVNQYSDGKGNYNIPTAQYAELAMGLANLISPTGSSEGDRQAIMSKTASGDLRGAIQYITGTPQNGNTQAIIKNLVDSIDRQGTVAQQLRDQDVQFLHGLAPTELDQSRIDKLEKNTLSSYTNPTQNVEAAKAQMESKLTTNLNNLKTTNPKLYTTASHMYTSNNPATGKPYDVSDILQAFPELNQ